MTPLTLDQMVEFVNWAKINLPLDNQQYRVVEALAQHLRAGQGADVAGLMERARLTAAAGWEPELLNALVTCIAELERQLAEARGALKPFADICSALENGMLLFSTRTADDNVIMRGGQGEPWFTMGDLRRARAALSAIGQDAQDGRAG